jgi:enoyl-CoA hydratase
VNEAIRCEVSDGVAWLTFDRPERLNALTFEMADRLVAMLGDLGTDPAARVVVLAGAGRAFCSGVDLDDHVDEQSPASKSVDDDERDIAAAARRWLSLWDCPKPVIVKAHGWCIGWGLEIALHADVVFASDDCKFFFPSVRNGGGLPDSAMVVHHVGPQWAKRLLVAGEIIDGRAAERIGLVSQSCSAAELDGVVADFARRLAALPAALVAHAKTVVNESVELAGHTALQAFAEHANAAARQDPEIALFAEILQRDGRDAAIAWRENRLR